VARNSENLTWRQARFLNVLAQGRGTTEQVERQLGMAQNTLRRWMEDERFAKAWERTNRLLELRRGADAAILGKPDGAPAPGGAPSADPGTTVTSSAAASPDATDTVAPEPRRPRAATPAEPRPPLTDRDRVRARHGEEAARAFEELLRRHRKDAAPVPTELSPPPG
jgi:hypothetical protein